MLTTNAIIGNTFFPNPYRVTANADGTYTWCKGFPLPERLHRTYTVQISKEQDDFCKCPVFLKLSYCKHVLATVNKFGLTSKRLGQGKFANHTNRKRGRSKRNTLALCVDPPREESIPVLNNCVPKLHITEEVVDQIPSGWIAMSDEDD